MIQYIIVPWNISLLDGQKYTSAYLIFAIFIMLQVTQILRTIGQSIVSKMISAFWGFKEHVKNSYFWLRLSYSSPFRTRISAKITDTNSDCLQYFYQYWWLILNIIMWFVHDVIITCQFSGALICMNQKSLNSEYCVIIGMRLSSVWHNPPKWRQVLFCVDYISWYITNIWLSMELRDMKTFSTWWQDWHLKQSWIESGSKYPINGNVLFSEALKIPSLFFCN